ncbi:hypothetical protein EBF03_04765 [Arcanobacterium haemolyticum]|uniref:Late embryogenesis abundant protein, putative / LEA protein, putative n=1 Tax=Arcanobacterium haemolyticum (strain ATCC 9345 / DSM 20595 / CCM 5947 / CCUG 17215 / LMG 16163 / NBRC 15585 / NCTC 8452 / 11018) TaxID=644284 RepID=D7BP31_ARCHD|nr:hypothetical protein [Arcanobacterium haemolyticum]ADH92680.1 late embryogenesis abundant protein, putative / LEA protein, putative [Arcanobacterium haemolyticum DSM 20595]QCX46790.1 hypothetical protein EBF03_04765 [Arcanobacterium haemolyticum]SQH28583.1 Uncharacterised protein [Arcanobacterium haemolyticum]
MTNEKNMFEKAADAAKELFDNAKETVTSPETKEKLTDLKATVVDGIRTTSEKATDVARDAKHKAQDMLGQNDSIVDKADRKLDQASETVSDKLGNFANRAEDKIDEANDRLEDQES